MIKYPHELSTPAGGTEYLHYWEEGHRLSLISLIKQKGMQQFYSAICKFFTAHSPRKI